jgi:uncharacterized repeat protein (TIGR03803 family)
MKKVLFLILFHAFLVIGSQAQHFVFYGITGGGGIYSDGMIYRFDPLSGKYDTLYSLNYTSGRSTWGNLTLANNGLLYGMTEDGGTKTYGVMFSFNPTNNKYNVLINFDSVNGAYQAEGNCLMQARSGLIYGTREVGGSHDSGVLFSYNIITGKDSVLVNFNKQNGAFPNRTLVEDTTNGYMYGTTEGGGAYGTGTIYRYDPVKNIDTVIYSFDSVGENGIRPVGNSLFMAPNGQYYGITPYGGEMSWGTIYRFNPSTFQDTTLLRFNGSNGYGPYINNLMQASNGLLYGIGSPGGTNNDGVIFSYDIITNKQTILVNMDGTNGTTASGDLVQDPDNGLIYGTTEQGGTANMGVIFCYNPITGKDSVVFNFTGTNGAYPVREPTLVKDTVTSINELVSVAEDAVIYPNPNEGKFAIEVKSEELRTKSTLEIYDVLGELVYTTTLVSKTTQIDISDKPSGVYIYKITSQSGELVSTGKLIKE